MVFWRAKKITSDEYADVLTRITKLSADVQILQAQFERLETRFKVLHGRINKVVSDEEQQENFPIDAAEMQRRVMGLGNRPE